MGSDFIYNWSRQRVTRMKREGVNFLKGFQKSVIKNKGFLMK